MSTRVRPDPGDERRDSAQDVYMDDEREGVLVWIKRRWWAIALLTLLATGALVAVIVGPICGIRGCPAKQPAEQPADVGPPRLIALFSDASVDALNLVPAVLRPYTTRIKLDSSLLQILDFVDEDVLQEAKKYIQQDLTLTLLARDFAMAYNPFGVSQQGPAGGVDLSSLLQTAQGAGNISTITDLINGLISGGSGRRLQQGPDATSDTDPLGGAPNPPVGAGPIVGVDPGAWQPTDPMIVNGQQWHHARINSRSAWQISKGAAPVIIAVIDTAFDTAHPDLQGPNGQSHFWVNTKEIPNNGIDDDNNGYVDDYYGYAFKGACANGTQNTATTDCSCVGSPSVEPTRATDVHGTHVLGLVGATLNSIGGAGTAPNVKLMLLKVAGCGRAGTIAASTVMIALDYAYKMGAHIVTMSLGTEFSYNWEGGGQPRVQAPPDSSYAKSLTAFTTAIAPLDKKGVLVLTAAGNENLDLTELQRLGYTYTPCMVALPNVMCVGASDLTDSRAFFSNFGAKVDLSAPGYEIMSTYWTPADPASKTPASHGYGRMNGTSMSTPITAGVAALVASILGTNDNNYFKAKQIRSILVGSGDLSSGLQGASNTSRRINAYNAALMALGNISTIGTPRVMPRAASGPLPGSTVQVVGFRETYWPNMNSRFLDSTGLVQLDGSFRNGGPSFSTFKYTSQVMVNMSAFLLLNVSGLHTFTLTYPVSYLGGRITVNGNDLDLISAADKPTASGSFLAAASGWVSVSFLFLPVPAGSVTVTLTTPGTSTPGLFPTSYVSWASQPFSTPALTNNYTDDTTPAWGYNTGWFVFFNRTDSMGLTFNASTRNSLYQFVKPDSYWQTQLIVNDLILPVNALKSTLAVTDSDSLLGYATTILNVSTLPSQVVFQVLCTGCAVFVNGLMVLDQWSGYGSRIPLTGTSSCVTINPKLAHYRVDVAFAGSGASSLLVLYKSCDGTRPYAALNNPNGLASLSTAVIDTTNTQVQNHLGWIGGVQCDVWRATANATSVPLTKPLHKFRLPGCPSPDLALSACTSPWSFALNSAIPGGLAGSSPAGTRFSARCWTYTNSSLPRLLTASPSGLTSNIWLGGLLRYRAKPMGTILKVPVPGEIRYQGTLHQLMVEWVAVDATQTLSLLGNGTPLTINVKGFLLPLWLSAMNYGDRDPNLNMVAMGQGGAYIEGYAATASDISGIVASDLSQVSVFSSAVAVGKSALNANYVLPTSPALANKVWYAVCEGYYYTLLGYAAYNVLKFDQAAGSSVQVLAGDVVIRNAGAFSPLSPALSDLAVEIWVPSGYLRMRIVTKIRSPAASVTYNWRVNDKSPSPDTLVNQFYWVRAAWQPQLPPTVS